LGEEEVGKVHNLYLESTTISLRVKEPLNGFC
jgi:hypothetical protein